MAFTVMELLFAGRAEAARTLTEAYFRFSGDDEGRRVLPFYIAYRSIVRGKVRGFELRQPEIPAERRAHSLARAKAHFLLALGALATSPRRPALVLVGGLPGTGKSTLAHSLAVKSGFEVIHSDAVRKELAGIAASENAASAWQSGIYSSEWTRRTYEECLRRAGELLFEGKRVAVDASFASEEWRSQFLEMARRLAIPAVLFVCEAPDEIVRPRLAQRRGDISDADEEVYRQARAAWTPSERPTLEKLVIVDTVDAAGALGAALAALRARDLA
jgi:predicted kinase